MANDETKGVKMKHKSSVPTYEKQIKAIVYYIIVDIKSLMLSGMTRDKAVNFVK